MFFLILCAKETSKLINETETNTKTLHLVQIHGKNNEFVFNLHQWTDNINMNTKQSDI